MFRRGFFFIHIDLGCKSHIPTLSVGNALVLVHVTNWTVWLCSGRLLIELSS